MLVLAGPLGSTLDIWQPHVDALAEQFQVLRYDHRGHGRSPVAHGSYAIQDLALDALALLDRLGIERAAFCGLSLGGMVGIWLAARIPERLSSLVLCSTTAAAHPEVVQQSIEMITKTADDSYVECCSAIAGWDGRRLLGRIAAPTLVIGGSQDRGTPVTPHAKTLASGIYRAKLEVLDAAHLAIIEQADRAKRLIAKHVAAR